MASSWNSLNRQVGKVDSAIRKLTPPTPDDEFEAVKGEVIKQVAKLKEYTSQSASGEESASE